MSQANLIGCKVIRKRTQTRWPRYMRLATVKAVFPDGRLLVEIDYTKEQEIIDLATMEWSAMMEGVGICEFCEQELELYYLPTCPGQKACEDCFREHLRECKQCDQMEQSLLLSDWMFDDR